MVVVDSFFFLSPGPSELDLSLLGETGSLADVACKYSEVRWRLSVTCWLWRGLGSSASVWVWTGRQKAFLFVVPGIRTASVRSSRRVDATGFSLDTGRDAWAGIKTWFHSSASETQDWRGLFLKEGYFDAQISPWDKQSNLESWIFNGLDSENQQWIGLIARFHIVPVQLVATPTVSCILILHISTPSFFSFSVWNCFCPTGRFNRAPCSSTQISGRGFPPGDFTTLCGFLFLIGVEFKPRAWSFGGPTKPFWPPAGNGETS